MRSTVFGFSKTIAFRKNNKQVQSNTKGRGGQKKESQLEMELIGGSKDYFSKLDSFFICELTTNEEGFNW